MIKNKITQKVAAFFLCLSIALCMGGPIQSHHAAVAKKKGGGGPPDPGTDYSPYLVEEDFEDATDYDMTGQWTEGGSGTDPNYTTTVLEGSESLFTPNGANTRISFTPSGSVSVCFIMRLSTISSEYSPPVYIYDQFGNILVQFYRVGAVWHFQHGATAVASSSTAVANTTQYVWIEAITSSGANDGVARLFISTNTNKNAAVATITTGTATEDFARLQFLGANSDGIFDHARVKSGATTFTNWAL